MITPLTAKNIVAALTLSVVSLSMGAAFGIMTGQGPAIGMISAALIALITALLGGTKVQCSGPTAPVTVFLVGIFFSGQDFSMYGVTQPSFIQVTVILAGLILALSGALGLGRLVKFVPNVVISGFMTGIGLLIGLSQVRALLGSVGEVYFAEKILFVLGAFVLSLVGASLTKKWLGRWGSFVSGTLLTLIVGTVASMFFGEELPRIAESLNQAGQSWNILSPSTFLGLSLAGWTTSLWIALQLAATMYIDTLLTSMVMDTMTNSTTNRKRELAAQGFAGVVMGFIGGIPGAQATARSVLLHKEGATNRWAGVMVGLFSLILFFGLNAVLGYIPEALFIGILLKVALDILDLRPLRIYIREWMEGGLFTEVFSRHDEAHIFVTNREMLFILGTTATAVLWGLVPAVILWTSLYWVLNTYVLTYPVRDLSLESETKNVLGED